MDLLEFTFQETWIFHKRRVRAEAQNGSVRRPEDALPMDKPSAIPRSNRFRRTATATSLKFEFLDSSDFIDLPSGVSMLYRIVFLRSLLLQLPIGMARRMNLKILK